MKAEVDPYDNWIMDHIVANKGTTTKLTREIAAKLQPMLACQHAAWNRWLIGYNCWPYNQIKVNIVGWAAREASDLEWSDESLGKIYIGDLDKDGSPHLAAAMRSDYGGGLGTYNFQQVDLDDMLAHLDDKELEIVSHEMDHGFGLPDFYEEPKPDNFPPTLIDAFTSSTVRDTDGWMLRLVLENKKSKYDF
ncbi:hypothetical protein PHYSODRAFT_333114 [Phytophthora sojae]|uniref:Neutral zinc metallopeptidase, Zn-binding site n=1 Tax=Phytophthora sojae (strain P6497) TaxID=1094619 RepID=G4ZNK5_PHYSP|nr:hypothetical protein PHYSODRAFT_333070 [Phytophthora sojae]XP_009528531.1 hypothetical protein PHYSODRAFT_333114 [Phytophthora sojae]EGZ14734.1 hypothetical protein PHYSODRAFT_333070 [Phytophthora sojae]EGZ14782.1 hypothetical protein PHYSODRAFT_333114 [Phytophthora sojae]|eukprot:XP_009528483.1 hypothetical protein PHYSODRAFT_333070 [Phytophthora sojae]